MKSGRTGTLAAAIALLALIGGCGDSETAPDDATGAAEQQAGFPVTVEDATGRVTVKERPERIVSLSPSATEVLFAVGAGEQVIAVDDQSDYPAGVPTTDLSSFQPNVEAIAGYEPDLVVAPADVPRDVIGGLRRLDLTVIAEPAPEELGEAYAQIRELATVTGHEAEGRRVARQTRSRVERLIRSAPDGESLSVFHELDPELFSAASGSFIGSIYARLGLRNIADPAAEKSGSAYPQLSSEGVVAADPDLVILADSECCDQTPAKVGRRPGWDSVSAVRRGSVVAIADDIASRWGPRLPIFVRKVVGAMTRASGAEAAAG